MKRRFFVLVNRTVNAVVHRIKPKTFRGGRLLFLTTTGRRSGDRRTVPLLYVTDGDDLVVAASNGGADWTPAWWLNLQASPAGTVEVDGSRFEVRAAAVDGPERDELWQRLSAQLDTYDDYQSKVRRRIAVVRLSPAR